MQYAFMMSIPTLFCHFWLLKIKIEVIQQQEGGGQNAQRDATKLEASSATDLLP